MHPWNKKAIDEDKGLKREYGLRTKREILIATSFLKKYKNLAKKLIARKTVQGEKEKEQVLQKLQELGLLSDGANLDQILSLEVKDILERRLQSIIFRKGLARTASQARQFIVHRHVMVGEKEITAPSYLTTLKEESSIMFKGKSSLSKEDHPERVNPAQQVAEEIEKIAPGKEPVEEPKAEAKVEKKVEEKKDEK